MKVYLEHIWESHCVAVVRPEVIATVFGSDNSSCESDMISFNNNVGRLL